MHSVSARSLYLLRCIIDSALRFVLRFMENNSVVIDSGDELAEGLPSFVGYPCLPIYISLGYQQHSSRANLHCNSVAVHTTKYTWEYLFFFFFCEFSSTVSQAYFALHETLH